MRRTSRLQAKRHARLAFGFVLAVAMRLKRIKQDQRLCGVGYIGVARSLGCGHCPCCVGGVCLRCRDYCRWCRTVLGLSVVSYGVGMIGGVVRCRNDRWYRTVSE